MEYLNKEEQDKIIFLKNGINTNIFELGKIEIDIQNIILEQNKLNKMKNDIISTLNNLAEQEMEFINNLHQKYGDKSINLETYEIK